MLIRIDPFREFDRLTQQLLGTVTRPAAMPMDAYRDKDALVIHFDLPGVDPDSIDLNVERDVLTVRAERRAPVAEGAQMLVSERPHGVFSRQVFLGDALDTDRIQAGYDAGVLSVTIPVSEQAKPRRIEIGRGGGEAKQITA